MIINWLIRIFPIIGPENFLIVKFLFRHRYFFGENFLNLFIITQAVNKRGLELAVIIVP